jgi:Holliday junction resolvase
MGHNASKRGKQYELDICTAVYEQTEGDIIPEPIGYSGNHSLPAPDVRIDDGSTVHAIELKRTSSDRKSIYHDPESYQKDDLDQLIEYCREYPRLCVPYVGVRFDNRELLLFDLWLGAPTDRAVVRSGTSTSPTDGVNYTSDGNLSVHKPELSEWTSATTGNDATRVLEEIGYW